MKRIRTTYLLAFSGLVLWNSLARSQEAIQAWHVVRPQENLHAIAQQYLGDRLRWPELAALNPGVTDPNLIQPGQRIRVSVEPAEAPDTAQVIKVSRRVEGQLTPLNWAPALEENLVNPSDGVRTFEDASTELRYMDSTRLVVGEDSLVFLGRAGAVRREVNRDEIEVVVGQADVEVTEKEAKTRAVVVGSSRMTPSSGSDDRSQARVRRSAGGGAQLMVYEGESSVESGGAEQTVERGMGTQMKDGEPPSPPEKLLEAVGLESPGAASEWMVSKLPFSWAAVEGAANYVLEICQDSGCGRLVRRMTGISTTDATVEDLEKGSYFWRVTAVSPSGLDGYPATPSAFAILATGMDKEGPQIAIALEGTQLERDGVLYAGKGSEIKLTVEDALSGVERTWAELDGTETALEEALSGWRAGPRELVISSVDKVGNETRSEPFLFVYDPVPPVVLVTRDNSNLYHAFAGELDSQSPVPAKKSKRVPAILWSKDRSDWRVATSAVTPVSGQEPRFFLRTEKRKAKMFVLPATFHGLTKEAGVAVQATDDLSGVESFTFSLQKAVDSPHRGQWLVLEAEDRLGNQTTLRWALWRGRLEDAN